MNYKIEYFKYKTKYLTLKNRIEQVQVGGNRITVLLFADILSNLTYPKKLVSKIKKTHSVIKIDYKLNTNIFTLEDLELESIAKDIYQPLDKKNRYIVIGVNQGCHISNYFSNKYKNIVQMQILVGNRRINEENYNKSVVRGYRMLEIRYDKDIAEKYKYGIQTNQDLKEKINSGDKFKDLVVHTINLKIRSQYDKIPVKQHIPTHIFDQLVGDKDIMFSHNLKNEETRKIKDIQTIEKAMFDHCKTNIDKVKQNNNMIDASKSGMVSVDYEIDILEKDIFTKNRIIKILYLLSK